jgi:CHAD domain-containing protein
VKRKSQAAPGDGVPLPGDASRTDLPDRVDGADGAPEAAPAPEAPRSPKLVADLPLTVAGARVLLEQLERIEAHEAGARSGDDPEDVHRMRVATRRLRAARRVFGPALADADPALDGPTLERANAELKALADALGRVRDLDVFVAALREHVEAAPAGDRAALDAMIAGRERERDAAQADLRALLDGGAIDFLRHDFHRTLEALAEPASAPAGKRRRERTVRRAAPRLIARALRRLEKGAADLLAPTSSELHARRIKAKRARYTAEFFAPAFGDALAGPVARLTAVQDALGELHDADVAVGALLGRIEAQPGAAARAADAAPLARLVARYLEQRDADLRTFRERWAALPGPRQLRRLLAGKVPPARKG